MGYGSATTADTDASRFQLPPRQPPRGKPRPPAQPRPKSRPRPKGK